MEALQWHTEQRKVADLLGLKYNPRTIDQKGKKALNDSLSKFNLVEIPVINLDNTIIAGNQRCERLAAAGRADELIDVRVPNRMLTDTEVKEYAVISNTHAGKFDADMLQTHFEDVLDGIDFEIGEVETFDFEALQTETLEAKEDDYQEQNNIIVDVETGDVFELKKDNLTHRLLCGDSTKADDVEKLMNGQKADLLLTDPPYGVSYAEKNKYLNTIAFGNRIQTNIANDHKTPAEMFDFWTKFVGLAADVMNKVSSYYIFGPQGGELLLLLLQSIHKSKFELKHILIWAKNNHVLGRCDYNYKHEPIIYGWLKKGTHKFYGGFKTSVLKFPKPLKNDLHPTMKPIELLCELINNSSLKEMIVIDFFLGSGSTMVAAHQLERNCYGIEYEPHYCQVILNRMQQLDSDIQITKNGQPWTNPNTSAK